MLRTALDATALAAERTVLETWILPSDPDRPVYSAIRKAFVEKFVLFYLTVSSVDDPRIGPEVGPSGIGMITNSLSVLEQLHKDCMTLTELLFDRSNLWAGRDAWRKPPIIKFLLRCLKRSKQGRPLTKLGIAAQAKELKMAGRTWPELTAKFCDCGKEEHQISCQDNLRREILHLEALLKRCGYPI